MRPSEPSDKSGLSPFGPALDPEEEPIPSADAVTPRGGFMARPGLKSPPRHAVIVRGGDAPIIDEIPRARSSAPPPPPAETAAPNSDEKITLRAIPPRNASPSPPQVAPISAGPISTPPVVESLPPPSDMPLVASVREPGSTAAPASSRRTSRSHWTIVVAAAAGLVLGLLSVVTTRQAAESALTPAAAPLPVVEQPAAKPAEARPQVGARPTSAPPAAASATPSPSLEPRTAPPPSAAAPATRRVTPTGTPRSIF